MEGRALMNGANFLHVKAPSSVNLSPNTSSLLPQTQVLTSVQHVLGNASSPGHDLQGRRLKTSGRLALHSPHSQDPMRGLEEEERKLGKKRTARHKYVFQDIHENPYFILPSSSYILVRSRRMYVCSWYCRSYILNPLSIVLSAMVVVLSVLFLSFYSMYLSSL